jgi:hypothetical protein
MFENQYVDTKNLSGIRTQHQNQPGILKILLIR